MPINTSGPLNISNLVNEFGGTTPHSLSEYYRNGPFVPSGAQNLNVPISGAISFSNFRAASKTVVVTYQLIGGGGAGGFGLEDGGSSGQAAGGTASSITGAGVNLTSAGGAGGFNGSLGQGASGPGQGTIFGPGGASVGNGVVGLPAPTTSYGAGGSGGGGDSPSTYDSSGNCGDGGFASPLQSGTLVIPYGVVLNITIGVGGIGSGGNYPGGNGANGFCRLSFDGKIVDFTSTATFVLI